MHLTKSTNKYPIKKNKIKNKILKRTQLQLMLHHFKWVDWKNSLYAATLPGDSSKWQDVPITFGIRTSVALHMHTGTGSGSCTWLAVSCGVWSLYGKTVTDWSVLGWWRSLYCWCVWGIGAAIWRPAVCKEKEGASRTDEGLHAEVSPPGRH